MTAIVVMTFGPALSVASPISTNLSRDINGAGSAPVVKSKWEMIGPYASLLGTDDSGVSGAQFLAPNAWDATMEYSICAVVTDPDSLYNADIAGVYTDIFYPSNRAFHPMDPAHPDLINGGTNNKKDYGLSGCGEQRGDENKLHKLSKLRSDFTPPLCGGVITTPLNMV